MLSRVTAKNVGDVFLRHSVDVTLDKQVPAVKFLKSSGSGIRTRFALSK